MARTKASSSLAGQQVYNPASVMTDGLDWRIMFPSGKRRQLLIGVLLEALTETGLDSADNGLD